MPPRLVEAVVDSDGTERPVPHDEPVQVVSPQTAREVTRMMEAVVGEGGTASNVVVDGYRIAGKTGTAQRLDESAGTQSGAHLLRRVCAGRRPSAGGRGVPAGPGAR